MLPARHVYELSSDEYWLSELGSFRIFMSLSSARARDGYFLLGLARLVKGKSLSKLELELDFLKSRVPYRALGSRGS